MDHARHSRLLAWVFGRSLSHNGERLPNFASGLLTHDSRAIWAC